MSRQIARAKINLTLHVGQVINAADDPFAGYHPLDSLVVFADIADIITVQPAQKTTLILTGPFAGKLDSSPDNLILKAYNSVAKRADLPPLSFHLEKRLPVAAGLGGGSANAAAALRGLMDYADLPAEDWQDIALSLGADVPVCLLSRSAHMTGIGGDVSPLIGLGTWPGVLLNPAVAVPTGPIFARFDQQTGQAAPTPKPRPQNMAGDLLARTLAGQNDLEAAAIQSQPIISSALRELSIQPGCQIARMSGSGASCFALFERKAHAEAAAKTLSARHPHWWVTPALFGEPA